MRNSCLDSGAETTNLCFMPVSPGQPIVHLSHRAVFAAVVSDLDRRGLGSFYTGGFMNHRLSLPGGNGEEADGRMEPVPIL